MPDDRSSNKGTPDGRLPPEIQGQIDEILAGRSTELWLELQNQDELTEIPQQIRELTTLQSLGLGDCDIKTLPSWLGELPDLKEISVEYSRVVNFPSRLPSVSWGLSAQQMFIFRDQVSALDVSTIRISNDATQREVHHVFDISKRAALQISAFSISAAIEHPPNREQLKKKWSCFDAIDSQLDAFLERQAGLTTLTLFGIPIGRVPEPIRHLSSLNSLALTGIFPAGLPDWIFEIPELKYLELGFNALLSLPESLGNARNLRSLYLAYNEFTRIPSVIWNLDALESINFNYCPIEEIPADILRLKRLKNLEIESRKDGSSSVPEQLRVPPPEIAAQGLDAIKRYWSQERDAGVDYLAEAKLLIVGEPGAGKTSLARKILNPGYALDADETSTEGIDVLAWTFPAGIRVREQGGERLLQRDFRVNIWDFGGQEIYHSTHQFFLTKRSVYVLVTDERREDTDFEYWLEIVNLLGGGSPLFIVQNRKQGRQHGLDLGAVRQRYPNIAGTLELNLADNSGLDAAVGKIKRELEQLPHIGTALPKTWQAVRLALEADSRNYISAADFFSICAANGFTDRKDMLQLGGYLHDLGICLFFQDDPLLSKTVILNPEWGTTAVYRVLDDPAVVHALGVFTRPDLSRIWSDATYDGMRDELLQLMVKFQLCFQVPGAERFIAPQLLTPSQPAYHWDESDNLILRYEYDVMPKGIVRRLIVALHYQIARGGPLWRSGAVFEYEGSRAEVIELYRRRLLIIRIRGGDPRVLLGLIEHELGIIHRSYPGIKLKKFIPCDCQPCSESTDPATFEAGELADFSRTGHQIQCRRSRQLRDPRKLLRILTSGAFVDGVQVHFGDEPSRSRPETHVQPEVFVSYKWGGDSEALVDDIQQRMSERGVIVTRDKDEVSYRDSIQQFMRRLGAGKCVIVILSQAYLESKNCMYELTQLAERPEFARRVYPVVLPDAGIFDPLTRVGYVKYWERKRAELDAAMREIGQEHLEGIREELDLYEDIRNTIARITSILADMNTLTPDTHRGTGFDQLYSQLASALQA